MSADPSTADPPPIVDPAPHLDCHGWGEIATVLGVSERTARTWAAETTEPRMPLYRFRHRVRARAHDLRVWFLRAHKRVE